jgi:hypothetical protein
MPVAIPARLVPIIFAVLMLLVAVIAVVAAIHSAPTVHGHEAMMHNGPNM